MTSKALVACMLLCAALFAATASAQTWTTGTLSQTWNTAGSISTFGFEVGFPAAQGPETWTIDVTASTASGCYWVLTDVTRSATGTSHAEYLASNPAYFSTGAPSGSVYVTPNYGGTTRRFVVVGSPLSAAALPVTATITITNQAGTSTPPAALPGSFSDAYAPNLGTSTTAEGYVQQLLNRYDATFYSTIIDGPNDEVQFDLTVDYGAVGNAAGSPFSLWANAYVPQGSVGAGNLIIDLWDMSEGGFGSTPTMQLNLNSTAATGFAGGGAGAQTLLAPANRTGVHQFRVVIRPGPGYSGRLRMWWQLSLDRDASTVALAATAVKTAVPRVAMTPLGSAGTLTTNTQLTASGGTPPATYSWSLQGTPPAGVTLSATTGTNVDLQFGIGVMGQATVRVTNGTTDEFEEQTYTVDGGAIPPVVVTGPATLPNGMEGVSYGPATVTASGGIGPYTWSATGLPAGVAINPTTGEISGTPTVNGTFNSVDVQAMDTTALTGNKVYTIVIDPPIPPVSITTTTLANGQVGAAYNQPVACTGGTAPYNWSIAGSLPPGLTLGASTTNSIDITGTPTMHGAFNFTVQVSDAAGNDTQALTINISPPPLVISTSTLVAGTVGQPYTAAVNCTGGAGPYTWSVSSGALPGGLTLDGSTSTTLTINGTPIANGNFSFTIEVVDSLATSANKPLSISIAAAPNPAKPKSGNSDGGSSGCAGSTNTGWILVLAGAAVACVLLRRRVLS